MLVAATNRPQEIDEAARRRFVKRLYVALPEAVSRSNIISVLMKEQNHALSEQDINELGLKTEGIQLFELRGSSKILRDPKQLSLVPDLVFA